MTAFWAPAPTFVATAKAARSAARRSAASPSSRCAPGSRRVARSRPTSPSRAAAAAREGEVGRLRATLLDPGAQRDDGLAAERRAALLAAFAVATNVGAGAQKAVIDAEPSQLGDAEPGPDRNEE